jgi:hypothetical protein
MNENTAPKDWKADLDDQIQQSLRPRRYSKVKALLFYWKDGLAGFQKEATELGRLFGEEFHYEMEVFPIPSSQCYLHVNNIITGSLLSITTPSTKNERVHSLLIIYYSGHGDENSNRRMGEEKRSVWAA